MCKKLFILFCFIFSLLLNPDYALANQQETLNIGYLPGLGFAKDLSTAGERGYIYQTFRRMETHSPYNFSFTAYEDVPSLLQALEDTKIDIALPMMQTRERVDKFMFGKQAVGTAHVYLVKKGVDYGYYHNPSEINGKTVASYTDSVLEPILDAYCRKHGLDITYVRGTLQNYQDIQADYYLISSLSDVNSDYDSVISLGGHNYYALYRKDDAAIADAMASSYKKVVNADAKISHQLFLKYHDTRLTRRDLAQEEMAALKGRTFTVGYIRNHPPIQYTNEQGQADGFAVEIFDILAKRYGFKVNYIPYSLTDPKQYHESFDFLLSLLGDYHHENAHYRRTEQYFSQPIILITTKTNALDKDFQMRKIKIGALQYISVTKDDIVAEYPRAEVTVYDTLNNMTLAFDRGEIDAMLTTNSALPYFNSIFGDTLFTFGDNLNLPFRLFVSRKLDPVYVNIFNVIFDYVDAEEFDEVVARQTLAFLPSFTFAEGLRIYRTEIAVAAVIVVILVFFIVFYLRSKHREAVLNVLKYDTLSGFENYSFFEKKVAKKMKNKDCTDYDLLSVDIDSFKAITTHYDYEVANNALKAMAKALDEHLKGSDGLITRTFADNFLLLYKRRGEEEVLCIIKDKIIPPIMEVLGESYPLSLSLGAYSISTCTSPLHIIVDRAHLAKGKGKGEHRTTFYNFDDVMMRYYDNRLNVTYRMESALNDGEFFLVFQPKIDFKTLQITGAEALVRWRLSSGDMIYPNDFIPVFEENGFIVKLDVHVFTKTCRFIKENGQHLKNKVVSVNISNRTMLEPSIVGRLKMIVDSFGIDPKCIELEITESAICGEFCMNKLQDFQAMGFLVSIDDFGAGVSSLNRLGNMSADVIKLDKTFLDICSTNPRGKMVIQDTISMAKHLDMKVVAEGVETSEQALWLQQLDCDIAQGYYFARPVPAEEFLAQLIEKKIFKI